MSLDTFNSLPNKGDIKQYKPRMSILHTSNGGTRPILFAIKQPIVLDHRLLNLNFFIIQDLNFPVLIGRQAMSQYHVKINFQNQKVTFQGSDILNAQSKKGLISHNTGNNQNSERLVSMLPSPTTQNKEEIPYSQPVPGNQNNISLVPNDSQHVQPEQLTPLSQCKRTNKLVFDTKSVSNVSVLLVNSGDTLKNTSKPSHGQTTSETETQNARVTNSHDHKSVCSIKGQSQPFHYKKTSSTSEHNPVFCYLDDLALVCKNFNILMAFLFNLLSIFYQLYFFQIQAIKATFTQENVPFLGHTIAHGRSKG